MRPLSLVYASEVLLSSQIVVDLSYSLEDVLKIFRGNDISELLALADSLVETNFETELRLANFHDAFLLESRIENEIKAKIGTDEIDQNDILAMKIQNDSIMQRIADIQRQTDILNDKIIIFKFLHSLQAKYGFSETHLPDLSNEYSEETPYLESSKEKTIFYNLEIAYLKTFIAHFKNLAKQEAESLSKNNITAMPESDHQLGNESAALEKLIRAKRSCLNKIKKDIKMIKLQNQKEACSKRAVPKDLIYLSLKIHNVNLKTIRKIKRTRNLEIKLLKCFFDGEVNKETGYIIGSIFACFMLLNNNRNK